MFFGKKKCANCESEYDVALPTCPVCGEHDAEYDKIRLPKEVTWMPWWRQLVIFLIGSIGLTLAQSFVLVIVYAIDKSHDLDITGTLAVNGFSYLIILGGMVAIMFPYFKPALKSFKKWLPYLMGLAAAGALYAFSIFYNVILQILPIEATDNANQSLAVQLVKSYPAISFILIGLLGPVAEELTYRVGLFTLGLRMKKWVAYVVVTIIFALIHFDFTSFGNTAQLTNELLNLPSYAFAGLTFCFLYDRWGLAASLSAHMTNNLLSCIFILL